MKDYSAVAARLKQLSDPWLSGIDPAQIDLSGCPSYRADTVEQDDGFHVPLAGHEAYRKDFRTATLDPEIIQTLAGTPGLTEDEKELVNQYSNPAFNFHTSGFTVRAEWHKDGWRCTAEHDESGERKLLRLSDVERDDRERVMTRTQQFLTPRKPWRDLTGSELLEIARMAPGSPESAIYTFINRALDGKELEHDISSDPQYQPLCDEIIWFVAENHFPEFDPDAYEFMAQKLGNRPLTWAMARELFALWKEAKFDASRRPSLLFNPTVEQEPPDTPESIQERLDNLSDSAFEEVRRQTLKLASGR